MPDRILVIAPHPDDGELGAGASIAKWIDRGDEVFYLALTDGRSVTPASLPSDARRRELMDATGILGIPESRVIVSDFDTRLFAARRQDMLEVMLEMRREVDPAIVLMPSLRDTHQDHGTATEEAFRAFKSRTILSYELPWNSRDFTCAAFSPVTEAQAERKLAAVACYRSQADRPYMAPDFLRGQMRFRGVQVGQPLAEVFEVPRLILR